MGFADLILSSGGRPFAIPVYVCGDCRTNTKIRINEPTPKEARATGSGQRRNTATLPTDDANPPLPTPSAISQSLNCAAHLYDSTSEIEASSSCIKTAQSGSRMKHL